MKVLVVSNIEIKITRRVILSRALDLCGEESLRLSQRPFAGAQGDMLYYVLHFRHSQNFVDFKKPAGRFILAL